MRDFLGDLAEHLGERYLLDGELGRGATATVYRARDLRLGRIVAIKVFESDLVGSLGVERFVREIALEAQLNHPHIVPLLDSGEVEGTPYFIMPCIDGESLRARLDREGQLPLDDAIQIARDVAVALMYAHERGIIHRDIKPENVLLTAGTAVVADFGIARALADSAPSRLTLTGIALGTVPYMSPEQALAEPVDGRSDIYSLGCLLYEMLVGESPHTGPTAQVIIAKRLHEPPRSARLLRASVSHTLDDVILHALAVNPADRIPTAKAFIDALARVRTGETTAAASPRRSSLSLQIPKRAIKRGGALLIAGVVVLAVGALGWKSLHRNAADAAAARAIAVLPFTDISERHDQEFFALGIAEELIRVLARLPAVRIAGRTSSFAFRDSHDDMKTIGAKLGVPMLLTGSIRRSGDSLRISTELVNVADGQTRWTGTYDRPLSDVFAVQEEIARAIAEELSVELGARGSLVAPGTSDVAAYQLYLRGRMAWAQRTPASLARSVDFYRQAVSIDPKFARAWASLSNSYMAIARNLFGQPADYVPLARESALRAVSLDSMNAQAHVARAEIVLNVEHDWAGAEQEFARAIALDSTYADAYYFHALLLAIQLKGDSALAQARRAATLEPLSGAVGMGPGMDLYLAGRSREAEPLLSAAIAANPRFYFTHIWHALTLATLGRSPEALKEADEAVRLAPDNGLMTVMRGQVLAMTGHADEARAVARAQEEKSGHAPVAAFEIARLYAALGDREPALEWIGKSIERQEVQATQLLTPGFERLRDDPRFAAYRRKMHIDQTPR